MGYLFYDPNVLFQQKTKKVVALAAWLLNLSTIGNLLVQEIFQDELNHHYVINKMDLKNRIKFSTAFMLDKEKNIVEQLLIYKIVQLKKAR